VIQNPGFLPDHPQNSITCSLYHARHTLKISERSLHNFLSYLCDTQTDKQTNKNWQKHYLLGEGKNCETLLRTHAKYSFVSIVVITACAVATSCCINDVPSQWEGRNFNPRQLTHFSTNLISIKTVFLLIFERWLI